MDTKAIEELIAIMDKAELTALRVDDGETKIELERNHGPLSSTALPLMADRVSALLAGKTESHEAAAVEDAEDVYKRQLLFRQPFKLESSYRVALPLSALGLLVLPGLTEAVPPAIAGTLATTGYMMCGIVLALSLIHI